MRQLILTSAILSLTTAIGCGNTFWRALDSQFRALEKSLPPQNHAQALLAIQKHTQLFQIGIVRIGELNDQEALDWYLENQTICPSNSSICEPMSYWVSRGILHIHQIQEASPGVFVNHNKGELKIWLDGPASRKLLKPYAREALSAIDQLKGDSFGNSQSTKYCTAILKLESLFANQKVTPGCASELNEFPHSIGRLDISLRILEKESTFSHYPDFIRHFYACYKDHGTDSNLIEILRWRLSPPGKPRRLISKDPSRPPLHFIDPGATSIFPNEHQQ